MNEQDWRIFKSKVPAWQEGYMESLISEYIQLLQGKGTASDKFWALERRIREERKNPGVVMDMRRSTMHQNIISLLLQGIISMEDLNGFSEELIDTMKMISGHFSQQEE